MIYYFISLLYHRSFVSSHHIAKKLSCYCSSSLFIHHLAMDKYRRVEKPRREEQATQVEANEIRITQQGKVRSYISYANGLFAVSF